MSGILSLAARRRGDPTLQNWAPVPRGWERSIIPTYDGSGITVHPSVVDMGRKWNGYRWWQANTPFPGDNERLENPCIWGSNDRWHWEVPNGLTNPLKQPPPAPGYNSDTELVFDPDTQRLLCFYREVSVGTRIKVFYSTNGSSWYEHAEVVATVSDPSPAIVRAGPGDWRMWTFGATPAVRTASDPLGPWSAATVLTFLGGPETQKWHGDVIAHQGRWLGVFGDSPARQVYTMSSHDGLTWTVSDTSRTTAYRPTMLPANVADHLDVYTGTALQFYNRWHIGMWPAP